MNEDYLNNDNINETSAEPVVSEPYRYKYENGEKRETPNESSYYSSGYNTYNYSTSHNAENTSSHVTVEVTKKKKKHRVK